MDINPYSLLFGFLFGGVGFVAWKYGRGQNSERHLILAILLFVFPYFVSNIWLVLLIGIGLTILLFYP